MNQNQENPVRDLLWKNRVLIVSSPSDSSVGYKRQEQLLMKGKKGMKERDLVIFRLYADHWEDHKRKKMTRAQAEAIRAAYQIDSDEFGVFLIGKDGGVKMRSNDIISTRELFQKIDAMPMRQNEQRKD